MKLVLVYSPALVEAMTSAGARVDTPYNFVLEKGLGERLVVELGGDSYVKLTFYNVDGGISHED